MDEDIPVSIDYVQLGYGGRLEGEGGGVSGNWKLIPHIIFLKKNSPGGGGGA